MTSNIIHWLYSK